MSGICLVSGWVAARCLYAELLDADAHVSKGSTTSFLGGSALCRCGVVRGGELLLVCIRDAGSRDLASETCPHAKFQWNT
ncbi:hypothetical protein K439DRAFT_1630151 [Ramaria rubella]|nr:hypothetical protein K439DRAFT_1630151 [Ramaria rubella]